MEECVTRRLHVLLVLGLLGLFLLSLKTGSAQIDLLAALIDGLYGETTPAALILLEIRLPRTLLAILVGAAMGLSGAALQGYLRNPLADPGLIGISQGAALGAAMIFYFNGLAFLGVLAMPVGGLAGAALTLFLLLGLSGKFARPAVLIMAGLALSALTSALLAMVLNFAPNPFAIQELVFWLLGSVSNRGMDMVVVLLIPLLFGALLIFTQNRLLFGLSLGDQVAESMGLSVARGGRMIVLGCALMIGAAVAVSGSIGFVGLVIPHLLRPLVKYRPDRLLLPSALAGGGMVLMADIVIRFLPPDRELKLGVLTALVGAPFFIWLVWKERQRWV
jgi:iron complex transport system permease protein